MKRKEFDAVAATTRQRRCAKFQADIHHHPDRAAIVIDRLCQAQLLLHRLQLRDKAMTASDHQMAGQLRVAIDEAVSMIPV